ncbi:MAG: isoprenyl transferase [Elusimicrobia bacterium]|nr:isoprenyl transferase [Candidatus Obscuribacterium magneticum]
MLRPSEKLLAKIDPTRLPRHVAIIMDGNGRWAKKKHLPRLLGHRAGTKAVRQVVETAGTLGLQVLTLYAFSTENWSRPPEEIDGLMMLLRQTLRREAAHLQKNNVRLETIGDLSRLPLAVQEELEDAKKRLARNTGLRLVLALNYGGRQDIIQACNAVLARGTTQFTEPLLSAHLQTAAFPDPDLLIRTSGEHRVSNFLLWQIAYAELYVTPVLWPDFGAEEFYRAVLDYQARERRYGGLG